MVSKIPYPKKMVCDTTKLLGLDIQATIFSGYPIYAKDIPRHSIFQWLRALLKTAVTLVAFDNEGSRVAKLKLGETQTMHKSFQNIQSELIILKARRDSAVLRAFIRLILESEPALPNLWLFVRV